ncbi:MAG: phage tail protein [Paenibacillus sp.]|jgi:phage tail-like protein|nr:phage tail protein [Paenibacillus sp.]
MADGQRPRDATGAFRFKVEIDGLLVAGFSDVTGMQSEIELQEIPEGGVNTYKHMVPKATKLPRIVLKRGITQSSELWDWYESALGGKITRKSGSIILLNTLGKELCRWNFFEAYPVKWAGPDLSASSVNVAVEAIEIVHNGLKTIFSK